MKLGLNVAYWGLGITPGDQLKMVKEAESTGFDSVWAAEAYGSDTATVLAWLAAQTEKIRIGSAIFQMPARTPAMTAMTAATLDELSGGRMILGIGSSGPQVAEGWHGQPFARASGRSPSRSGSSPSGPRATRARSPYPSRTPRPPTPSRTRRTPPP